MCYQFPAGGGCRSRSVKSSMRFCLGDSFILVRFFWVVCLLILPGGEFFFRFSFGFFFRISQRVLNFPFCWSLEHYEFVRECLIRSYLFLRYVCA